MIGYKAFDKDLKCRGFQFEVGKIYTKDVKKKDMKLCSDTVFHFCRELFQIERNSEYKLSESRICEVIAGEDVIGDNGKYGTNSLMILREIVGDEKDALINSGDGNSGDWNSGDCNSGNRNSGNCNSGNWNSGGGNSGNRNSGNRNLGNRNSGNRNSGNWNTGSSNTGDWNSGDGNTGNWNSGNRNSGDWNSGDWNSGDCNSGNWNSGNWNSGNLNSTEAPFRIFNKETDVYRDSVVYPNFFYFNKTSFVSYDTARDWERKRYKNEIEVCGGFWRKLEYKEAWRKSWNEASDEDRRKVLQLPNWDNEIFKEISGIDVEKELGITK